MRVAVDDAEAAERKPPGGEHRGRKRVAHRKRRVLVGEHARAVEPVEGEQPPGRKLRPRARHANDVDALEHRAVERDVLGLAAIVELLAHARADLLADLAWCRSRNRAGGGSPAAIATAADRLRPPTACRDIAACRPAARRRASARDAPGRAKRQRPADARNSSNFSAQSAPSSAIIRRLTKAQPIGGASLCSFGSSAAYSGGSRSGTVAINCATFINGPLSRPSAADSALASPARSARRRPVAVPA